MSSLYNFFRTRLRGDSIPESTGMPGAYPNDVPKDNTKTAHDDVANASTQPIDVRRIDVKAPVETTTATGSKRKDSDASKIQRPSKRTTAPTVPRGNTVGKNDKPNEGPFTFIPPSGVGSLEFPQSSFTTKFGLFGNSYHSSGPHQFNDKPLQGLAFKAPPPQTESLDKDTVKGLLRIITENQAIGHVDAIFDILTALEKLEHGVISEDVCRETSLMNVLSYLQYSADKRISDKIAGTLLWLRAKMVNEESNHTADVSSQLFATSKTGAAPSTGLFGQPVASSHIKTSALTALFGQPIAPHEPNSTSSATLFGQNFPLVSAKGSPFTAVDPKNPVLPHAGFKTTSGPSESTNKVWPSQAQSPHVLGQPTPLGKTSLFGVPHVNHSKPNIFAVNKAAEDGKGFQAKPVLNTPSLLSENTSGSEIPLQNNAKPHVGLFSSTSGKTFAMPSGGLFSGVAEPSTALSSSLPASSQSTASVPMSKAQKAVAPTKLAGRPGKPSYTYENTTPDAHTPVNTMDSHTETNTSNTLYGPESGSVRPQTWHNLIQLTYSRFLQRCIGMDSSLASPDSKIPTGASKLLENSDDFLEWVKPFLALESPEFATLKSDLETFYQKSVTIRKSLSSTAVAASYSNVAVESLNRWIDHNEKALATMENDTAGVSASEIDQRRQGLAQARQELASWARSQAVQKHATQRLQTFLLEEALKPLTHFYQAQYLPLKSELTFSINTNASQKIEVAKLQKDLDLSEFDEASHKARAGELLDQLKVAQTRRQEDQAKLQALRDQVKAVERNAAQQEGLILAKQRDKINEKLGEARQEKETAVQTLKHKYEAQIQDAQAKSLQHQRLTARVEELERQIKGLEQDKLSMTLSKTAAEKEIQDLESQVAELKGYEDAYKQIKQEYDELQSASVDTEFERDELQKQLQALEAEAADAAVRDKPDASKTRVSEEAAQRQKDEHMQGLKNYWERNLRDKVEALEQVQAELAKCDEDIARAQARRR